MRIRRKRVKEIDEEIATHIAMATADRIARGESPQRAHQGTVNEFGNPLLVRETTWRMWGGEWWEHVVQDLRYAWRQMQRSSSFTLTVIVTLAVGIGAAMAMFTVVERVLLNSLPYENGGHLVAVEESGRKGDFPNVRWLDIQQWRFKARSFEEIGFYTRASGRPFLEGDSGAQQVTQQFVSSNLFQALGVRPALGQGFSNSEGQTFANGSNDNSVVLSDSVWRESFGARQDILGSVVRISGQPYTVVGVMPRSFAFPFPATKPQVWTAVALKESDSTRTSQSPTYQVIARLKREVKLSTAQAEMNAIQTDVAKQYTDRYLRDLVDSVKVQSYDDSLIQPEVRRALLSLFTASGLLWFIACVNVAGLLLTRGTVRQREVALRGALGASRMRIIQQLLLEGLMLSVGGSLLGLIFAVGLLKLFSHGLAMQLNVEGAMPGGKALIALLVLTMGSAIASALWPAVTSARVSIEPVLRQSAGQSSVSRSQYQTRSFLVILQIALSLVLLVSCGLLLRTIYALRHVPLGFRTDHIVVGSMAIPSYRFAGQNINKKLYEPLLEHARGLPGVESATLMTEVPLGRTYQMAFSFAAEGNSADAVKRRDFRAQFRAVGPDAQKVFGFKMLKGRFFNDGDIAGSQPVVVVNRAFVKQFSESDDPNKIMGQNLLSLDKGKPSIVIGVLDDTRQVSPADQSAPEIEVFLPQLVPGNFLYRASEGMAMDLAIRSSRDSSSLIPELRSLIAKTTPELADTNFTTMTQVVEDAYGSQQIMSRLLTVFGVSALLLCLSGIYGLLAQLVSQRTREIGVRVALGASRDQIFRLILSQAGRMMVVGTVAGLTLAWFTSHLVSGFLYGIATHDVMTMATVAVVLATGGLAAAWIPAKRAAAINPVEALRAE
jgi:predicted permease